MASLELEEVQKRHEELLNRSDDIPTEDIQKFLTQLSQTGSVTEDVDQRALLRSLIRYWSSLVYARTGGFPSVELVPFAGKPTQRLTRRTALKIGAGLGVATLVTAAGIVIKSLPLNPFNVYTDAGDSGNHYAPSGLFGDSEAIRLTEDWTDHPHSGTTCISVVYSGIATQGYNYAGVFWQDPPNNWGVAPGGYDLSHYLKLSFWVRGQSGGERIQFFVGGIQGPYGDSLQPALFARDANWITLTTSWQPVTINLKGQNLTHIIGAFGWSTNNDVNPQGATFYLDDIAYSF